MTKTYDSELRELRDEIINGDARTSAIDSAINSLRSFNDDRLAKDLLSLLSDDAEYDEGMFSLIHASEAVENPAYVNSLLASFANLAASSPRWASIVLMRALNNDATRQELVAQLRTAASTARGPIREICLRIDQVSPEFLARTTPVLVAAAPSKLTPVR